MYFLIQHDEVCMMKYKNILLASLVLSVTPFVYADKDLSRDNIQTVVMEMRTIDGNIYFNPSHLNFKTD
jgi:hypothetical protein